MKYGIYDGSLIKIVSESETAVQYESYSDSGAVSKDKIIIVSDETYQRIQNEYTEVVSELNDIRNRIYNLDTAYHTKKNALYQKWMEARQRETSLISRMIKESQK